MLADEIFDFNLPDNLDVGNIQDVDLLNAHEKAMASNSITPLLKQELRYKIQTRRLTEGKDELCLSHASSTSKSYKLTPAEIEKRKRRREQNRQAAKRFRQKKKDEVSTHSQEVEILQAKNTALRAKLESLIQERSSLVSLLADHVIWCTGVGPTHNHAPIVPLP